MRTAATFYALLCGSIARTKNSVEVIFSRNMIRALL